MISTFGCKDKVKGNEENEGTLRNSRKIMEMMCKMCYINVDIKDMMKRYCKKDLKQ